MHVETILAVVVAVLLALSAFFSASETIIFSLAPVARRRLERRSPRLGRRLEQWLGNPSLPLAAILAGNTLVNFALAGAGYVFMRRMWPAWGEAASVPVFTVILLVFGEIGPKQYAIRHAERLAPACAAALAVAMRLLRPVSALMVAAQKVFDPYLTRERRALSDGEFKIMVENAAASGLLDREEANMVEGVLRLADRYAVNEMTPRVKLETVSAALSPGEMAAAAARSAHDFLPVCEGDADHITGFYEKATGAILPPLRVEELSGLDDLLITFMKTGRRIALVEDRWGGTAGIITRGDILEVMVKPVVGGEEAA